MLIYFLVFTATCGLPATGPLKFRLKNQQRTSIISPIITGEAKYDFNTLYEHILKPKCIRCHQGDSAKPENDPIDLTKYEFLVEDRFVPVLIKGNSQRSRLFVSTFKGEMPPKVPLEEIEIAYIKKWIELCAPETTDSSTTDCFSGPGDDDDEPGDDDDEPMD